MNPSRFNNRSFQHRSAIIIAAGLLSVGLWWLLSARSPDPEAAAPGDLAASQPAAAMPAPGGRTQPPPAVAPVLAGSTDPFRGWLADYRAMTNATPVDPRRAALLNDGLALAEQRRARMAQLIRENPQQALAEALRFDEYFALPESVRSRVERPFSERAGYTYLPVCAGPDGTAPAVGVDHFTKLSLPDGTDAEAFTYGRRAAMTSKRSLPASGIVLDGVAALQDGVFREVQAAERETVLANFSFGQSDAARSFATGQPVSGEGVMALAGGRLFVFADRAEMQQLDAALSAFDDKPGPNSGSSVLFNQALPLAASGGFNVAGAETLAGELASEWTETKKKVFLIRVDFSDAAGEPVTEAAASSVLNGSSSDLIHAMSYGKTWLEAGVSANVYRLPQTAAYYVGGDLNGELMRDARNIFRNTRSGADATINIGPVSNTGSGGEGGLGDYDVVGIFFTSIGMSYAGLASVGGGDLWVQNANTTGLYVHELGHNYGLLHASFWQTSDGSVIGAGSNEEYGDAFDIMGGGPVPRGHYHPQGKARLNWLTTNQWADATASGSGTYRVYRIDDAGTTNSIRGLRVTKSAVSGSEEYYWVGHRPAFTENAHLRRGAYLIWQRPAEARCWLLDTTPGSADGKNDSPLDLGRTYSDTNANVHLTPVAAGGAGSEQYLDVRVNLGAFSGNSAPTVSAFTGSTTVSARSNYAYSVTATDSDADPLAYWWNAQDGGVNDNSNAITRSWTVGGTYSLDVTVSDMKGGTLLTNKTIVVSDPLDAWTAGSLGAADDGLDVCWGKGRFVAADYWGTLFLSWDATNWANLGKLPDFEREPKLAFGANTFVVAGKISGADAAQVGYSADGRLWSVAAFPAGVPQVRDVAFGGGQFVAVADDGAVLRSTNGATWSLSTMAGYPDFRHVTWDGAVWLAVAVAPGDGWPRQLWTSTDGATWTQRDSLGSDIFSLNSHGGTAYALGWYAGLLYSTDHGDSWQNALLPGTTSWTTHRMAAADDGTLLLAAQAMSESGAPRALLVSTDGRAWSRAGNTNAAYANSLVFGAGAFLGVENGGVTRRSASFYPDNHAPAAGFTTAPTGGNARSAIYFAANATDADGDTPVYAWDFGSETAILDDFEIAPIFSFGGSYSLTLRVSDGRGGLATLSHTVTVSDPARTWTQRASGTTRNLMSVAASTGTIVAIGANGTVLSSANGTAWTSNSLPDWGGNIYLDGVAWDGSRFNVVGVDYDGGVSGWVGVIYSSPNGVTWTRRYKSATTDTGLHAIAASGSASVAVGNNGTVLRTTDGTNWSAVSVPGLGTPTVSGVACGGGTFVLVAYTGGNGTPRVFASGDGLSWLDYSSGAGLASWQDLRKVAWLNNRFVASGFYSRLRVSTDAGQTFSTTRSHAEQLPALAFGNGCWFAAGVDLDASNADMDVMSLDGANWLSFAAPTSTDRHGAAFFNGTFVTVGDSGSIWQSGVVSPADGWPAWQLAQFPAGSASCLANRDPDGDGVANIVEYALGRDPNLAAGTNGSASLPAGVVANGRFWLRLDLPEPAVADVNYVVSGATNLPPASWNAVARKNGTNNWQWLGGGTSRINASAPAGGRAAVDVGTPDAFLSQPNYFLRLTLEAP